MNTKGASRPPLVKTGRKVDHLRRLKVCHHGGSTGLWARATVVAEAEPAGRGRRGDGRLSRLPQGSGEFSGAGRPGVEGFASEPVAVALRAEDLGVVDEAVDHRGGGHVVAEDLAPRVFLPIPVARTTAAIPARPYAPASDAAHNLR